MATRYEHYDTSDTSIAGGYSYAGQSFTPSIAHIIRMVKIAHLPPAGETKIVTIHATSGGLPTGTGATVADGTVVWTENGATL